MLYRFIAAAAAVAAAFALPAAARAAVAVDGTHVELMAGTSAALPPPRLTEGRPGDVGAGTVVLRAPDGFAFATDAPVTVSALWPSPGRCDERTTLLLGRQRAQTAVEVWPTRQEIAVEVTERSRGTCRVTLEWSGIAVEALGPGGGAVTLAGSSAIAGASEGTAVATVAATTPSPPAPGAGRAYSWGSNVFGELGIGYSGQPWATPQAVVGLEGALAVGTGDYNTFAVRSDGTVWGTGMNAGGSLGDGTRSQRDVPVQALGVAGAVDVAAGYAHTLALTAEGTVWSWGGNDSGQLGDGTTDTGGPKPVAGLSGVVAIAAGRVHSLALTAGGRLYAWGENGYGQLGDGSTTSRAVPTPVLEGVREVAAGDAHTVALRADGTVWTFGQNWFGQLGTGTQSNAHSFPQQVAGLSDVAAVGAGDFGSFAVGSDGIARAWGYNQHGQLGIATVSEAQTTPAAVGLAGVAQVDGGEYHTLFRLANGLVYASGSNYYGTLGEGWRRVYDSTASPVLSSVPPASDIAATELHSAAVAG